MNRLPTRRLWFRAGLLLALATGLYFGAPWVLSRAGMWLNVGGPLATPMQFGYVLGGGADVRPVAAAALYRSGRVSQILLPNLTSDVPIRCKPLTENELVQAVLLQEGVPMTAVTLIDGAPQSTEEEMAALARFLREQPACSVALITHDYHSRRCERLFRRELELRGLQKTCGISVISVPTDGYSAKNWWCTEEGLLNYGLEFAKTLRDFLR
ncbi:MAG: YdcF family protein [Planctomycetaceae bacterium]|nr:YdcF family protein [Planctomycetaceae bacterium]